VGAIRANRDHFPIFDINLDPAEGFAGAYLASRPVCPHRGTLNLADWVLSLAITLGISTNGIALREESTNRDPIA